MSLKKEYEFKKTLAIILFTLFLVSIISIALISAETTPAPDQSAQTPSDSASDLFKTPDSTQTSPGDVTTKTLTDNIGDLFEKAKDGTRITWNWIKDKTASILGFKASFWYNFGVGLVAGIIIYVAGAIGRAASAATPLPGKKKKGFVVSLFGSTGLRNALGIFEIPVVAVIYGVVMKLPVVNKILQIIMLTIFLPTGWEGFFIEALWLAVLVGFAPTIIRRYIEFRAQERARINAQKIAVGEAILKQVGESAMKK